MKSRHSNFAAFLGLILLCGFAQTVFAQQPSYDGKIDAPEFPEGLDWLNTDGPLKISQFKGKVVLLDFWTYCCINCMHVIPDLKKLEEKYPNELVVIGVHTAKFTTEKGTDNIREAILRYELTHPVVNDGDFKVWNTYDVHAWPSFWIINPDGKVVARHSGEDVFPLFDKYIGGMIAEFDKRKKIDRTPIKLHLEKDKAPRTPLSFPGKLAIDGKAGRLYLSDSNHNRIVSVNLADGAVVDVIGSGKSKLVDGTYEEAAFFRPQGVHLDGDSLYVADTENHAVRKVDLKTRTVSTLAGTGEQSRRRNATGKGTQVALNSPWDLLSLNGKLYIAMAGPHQLWTLNLSTQEVEPYAGSGMEGIDDKKKPPRLLKESSLAQPSGITTDGTKLYFADSEVSAIRSADLDPKGVVRTIIGEGLFDFADHDGDVAIAKLQHPLGILYHEGTLYVADTYNNKVKKLDAKMERIETLVGTGKPGFKDGPAKEAQLNEPAGLAIHAGKLYIADTNNHMIRILDLKTNLVSTLTLSGIDKLSPRTKTAFDGRVVKLAPTKLAPGAANIEIALNLPPGYKLNSTAPFYLGASSADGKVALVDPASAERNLPHTGFPSKVPVTLTEGKTELTIDLVAYYCDAAAESACLVDQVRVVLPLEVSKSAKESTALVKIDLKAAVTTSSEKPK